MKWTEFKLPPINLLSAPKQWLVNPWSAKKCKHGPWMMLHSHKERWCYRCGKREPIKYDIKIEYQR